VRLGQFAAATATAKQFVTQSEYPLNVGNSAVPVEVPVTLLLTEDTEDPPVFDNEECISELTPV